MRNFREASFEALGGGGGWVVMGWARVSYFRFVSVGLQNARDCRAELRYAVYQQTGLNQHLAFIQTCPLFADTVFR